MRPNLFEPTIRILLLVMMESRFELSPVMAGGREALTITLTHYVEYALGSSTDDRYQLICSTIESTFYVLILHLTVTRTLSLHGHFLHASELFSYPPWSRLGFL